MQRAFCAISLNISRARVVHSVTPYFPFKGIPRFYDIGGFLKNPEIFQLVIDVFVERYKSKSELLRRGAAAREMCARSNSRGGLTHTRRHHIDCWVRCTGICSRPTHCSGAKEALYHAT